MNPKIVMHKETAELGILIIRKTLQDFILCFTYDRIFQYDPEFQDHEIIEEL